MGYSFPDISLLDYHNTKNKFTDKEYVKEMANELITILESYKVKGKITDIKMTPFAILFDFMPDQGVSVKTVKSLRVELEVHMAAQFEIVGIGEKQFIIGIAMKNWVQPIIGLRDIMETKEFKENNFSLPIAAGMDVLGKPFIFDLATTPHLLVAGTTGSGKSTFLNTIILSLLYTKTPDEVRFVMIDPKVIELNSYSGIPHMYIPVISDMDKALSCLKIMLEEMTKRYNLFKELSVKNIDSFNEKTSGKKMNRIVIIVDEYMELMFNATKEVENIISRLSALGRAAGIHLIIATQRPTKDVITSSIKANLPCRASFTVVDWRESKTILDRTGAERLLGNGDMLYSAAESGVATHAQASFVTNEEIEKVVEWVKKKNN